SSTDLQSATRAPASDGPRLLQTYDAPLQRFTVEPSTQHLRQIRSNPDVAYAEQDTVVTLTGSDSEPGPTWGLDRIHRRNRPVDGSVPYAASGEGLPAHVIDAGIRTGHNQFPGRAGEGFSAINDGQGAQDCNGRGTHVAGTVGGETYGVAQDV